MWPVWAEFALVAAAVVVVALVAFYVLKSAIEMSRERTLRASGPVLFVRTRQGLEEVHDVPPPSVRDEDRIYR